MKGALSGDWHIVLIQDMNITKITDISTGFYYWNFNDTWALWHSASPFTQLVVHLVIYNGNPNTTKDVNLVTTKDSSVGRGVSQ